MLKLSYILPIYNVERYLKTCLDSIFSQNISTADYEVICVNDCSIDNSREIILEYQKKYTNLIFVEHTKNKKAGAARNTGLSIAKGKYIWFIDADDSIMISSSAVVLKYCFEYNLDVLCFNYQRIYNNEVKLERVFTTYINPTNGVKFLLDTFGSEIIYHLGYAVRAVYRRKLLLDKDIHFPEDITYGEDTIYMVEACMCSERVMSIVDTLYNYYQRESSSTTKLMVDRKGEQIFESIFVAGSLVYRLKNRAESYSTSLPCLIESGIPWFVNRLFIRLIRTNGIERRKFYDLLSAGSIYSKQLYKYMDIKNSVIVRFPWVGRITLCIFSWLYTIKKRLQKKKI